jgi:predicted HTH domain antitoxin
MSKSLAIELDDDVLLALQAEPEQVIREMRLYAAAQWYRLGRVSQGKAAQIAGLSRGEFVSALAQFAVSPFQETAVEISQGGGDP